MRRVLTQKTPRNAVEPIPQSHPEMNLKLWIQLSVDQHQKTSRLLEEQQHQTSILLRNMQKLQE